MTTETEGINTVLPGLEKFLNDAQDIGQEETLSEMIQTAKIELMETGNMDSFQHWSTESKKVISQLKERLLTDVYGMQAFVGENTTPPPKVIASEEKKADKEEKTKVNKMGLIKTIGKITAAVIFITTAIFVIGLFLNLSVSLRGFYSVFWTLHP